MRVREFAKTVDHTLLKPDATEQEILRLCKEASHYHFAAVCIPPSYVPLAARELRGGDGDLLPFRVRGHRGEGRGRPRGGHQGCLGARRGHEYLEVPLRGVRLRR